MLWIRTQDKIRLVKVDKILIKDSDIGNYEVGLLGTYKTKERAIEILDEIQEKIECYLDDKLAYVYEMPEE